MNRRSGIGLFFIAAAMVIIGVSSKHHDAKKEPPPAATDNGSMFARYGETFDDQMGVKTRPDSFTIPLTIVTAPPEIPREAQITLGKQREEIQTKNSDEKISTYERDIFIYYPAPMLLNNFRFTGFKATTPKNKIKGPNRIKYEEVISLRDAAESVDIKDIQNKFFSVRKFLGIQTDPSNRNNEEFEISLFVKDEFVKFTSKETIKLRSHLRFKCNKTMIKKKSVYKLDFEVAIYVPGDVQQIVTNTNLPLPVNDFFVINCGE